MNKTIRSIAAVALCFLFCVPAASAQEEESQIAHYLHLYGQDLPKSIQDEMHKAFTPVFIELEDVRITLREILYDGQTIYTSAEVVPVDPSKVLILPGFAWVDDAVAGRHDENERMDQRTLMEAARADGQRLVHVTVLPNVFEGLPHSFDYVQRASDVTVLLSEGEIGRTEEILSITWVIQAYEIDTAASEPEPELIEEITVETTVSILAPVEKKLIPCKTARAFRLVR